MIYLSVNDDLFTRNIQYKFSKEKLAWNVWETDEADAKARAFAVSKELITDRRFRKRGERFLLHG